MRKNSGRQASKASAARPQAAAPESRSKADCHLLNTVDSGRLLCSLRMMPWILSENSRTGRYNPKLERRPFTPMVDKQYARNKMLTVTREKRIHFHSALKTKAVLFL